MIRCNLQLLIGIASESIEIALTIIGTLATSFSITSRFLLFVTSVFTAFVPLFYESDSDRYATNASFDGQSTESTVEVRSLDNRSQLVLSIVLSVLRARAFDRFLQRAADKRADFTRDGSNSSRRFSSASSSRIGRNEGSLLFYETEENGKKRRLYFNFRCYDNEPARAINNKSQGETRDLRAIAHHRTFCYKDFFIRP